MNQISLINKLALLGFLCLGYAAVSSAQVQVPRKAINAKGGTGAKDAASARGVKGAEASAKPRKQTTESPRSSDAGRGADSQTAEPMIQFSFAQEEWKEVIPWFAEQAGFSLQPVADWPDGTLHLVDDSQYTVVGALDQLNHALRIRNPPYTLIRNRNLLVLVKADQADAENYPPELVETVPVSDLDQRGKYELMRCVFEFGELDAMEYDQQLKGLVSQENKSAYHVLAGANEIIVRETGNTLRLIRDIIMTSRKRHSEKDSSFTVYRLKHTDADSFLFVARELLGIAADRNQREDGSLAIAAEPLSDRLFVKGTASALKQFEEVALLLDVPPEAVEDTGSLDKPYLHAYPVTSDPALAFATLQTFLDGRDGVLMQQDGTTGAIVVLGRKADHEIAAETLTDDRG